MLRLVLLFVCSCLAARHELLPYNPVANPGAVVISPPARFTVLTSSLIRIEYAPHGSFEDRPTLAFVNRNLPVPGFSQSYSNGWLRIQTSTLTLSYKVGSAFSSSTLLITANDGSFHWYYGYNANVNSQSPRVMYGTIKSLDLIDSNNLKTLNCSQLAGRKVNGESLHCEYGLMSRDGWVIVNDQDNHVINENDWWDGPNSDDIDIYFFGHGKRYTDALKDYSLVGGKIAMVPKYITGIWWSRWYNLNNQDVKSIVETYKSLSFPLDVFVLDMDWHTKQGWGGYTWDKNLFPYPEATTTWLRTQGLHLTANIHDNDGVRPNEDQYAAMARALGVTDGTTIPFVSCVNQTVAYALEDIVLGAAEQQGIDFWWIDWQQGGDKGGCTGLKNNPTIWLSKLRGTDRIRRNDPTRAVVLGRWGGFGTHRYQVGFSGDVARLTWQNLALQPYFSWTGSNVGYGFWSHDLVGPYNDHELHTRWLQWGAFSAVFRTHDRGMAVGACADYVPSRCAVIAPWDVPNKYMFINREAMVRREELVPYIYTAYRQAYDTGVSIIRPMYYSYPDLDMAYSGDISGNYPQYMFGDSMLVSPIVTPAGNNSLTSQSIWLPAGNWYDLVLGSVIKSVGDNFVVRQQYDLSEIPIFVPAGSIIPGISVETGDTLGLAQRQYTNLVFTVYPGPSSSASVYEDDGTTTAYVSGKYSWTDVSSTVSGSQSSLYVHPTNISPLPYPQFPMARSYTVKFVGVLAPTSVTVNGQPVAWTPSPTEQPDTWYYCGKSMAVVVRTNAFPTNEAITVSIEQLSSSLSPLGVQGILSRAEKAKALLDLTNATPGTEKVVPAFLSQLASVSDALGTFGNNPTTFNNLLSGVAALYQNALKEVAALKPNDPTSEVYHLWDHAMGLLSTAVPK